MKFVELNHYIVDGIVSYPGTPGVEITAWKDREEAAKTYGEGGASMLDQIKMLNISGTYIDAPYHRWDEGYRIGDIPLEKLFDLPAFVVHMSKEHNYFDKKDLVEALEGEDLKGAAVILHSGYDKLFGTPEYEIDTPYLKVDGAEWLMEQGVYLVGIDTPLLDSYVDCALGNPVHDIILSKLAVICEDMCHIEEIPDRGAKLYAIPPRVDMASFPARVFAVVDDEKE